jgi:hypothetical protein
VRRLRRLRQRDGGKAISRRRSSFALPKFTGGGHRSTIASSCALAVKFA